MLRTVLIAGMLFPSMTQGNIKSLIAKEAKKQGICPRLAIAVAIVESNLNPEAIGSQGEIGVFQLHPRYFPTARLGDLTNNISLAIGHLKYWKKHCPVKANDTFVTCYNQGFRAPRFPTELPYYKKVMRVKAGLQ